MAVKKRKNRGTRVSASRRRQRIRQLADQLAPLEEVGQDFAHFPEDGALMDEDVPVEEDDDYYVDGSMIIDGARIPNLNEVAEYAEGEGFVLDRVVVVVTLLALLFIGFIAYLIATMPNEDKVTGPEPEISGGLGRPFWSGDRYKV